MQHCKQRLKNYICRIELIEGSEGDKRRELIEGNEDGPKNLFSEDCVYMKRSLLTDRYATYICTNKKMLSDTLSCMDDIFRVE